MFLLIAVIIFSLGFALSNGLHDASSVVATLISSGAARPRAAILLASVFGLLGAVTGGRAVADTMSSLIDLPAESSLLPILLASVIGALAWNLLTWRLDLPSSSTHALVGGMIGAVLASSGGGHILWGWQEIMSGKHPLTGFMLVVAALAFSPVFGFTAAFILEKTASLVFRNARFSLNKSLNHFQFATAAMLAYSHGANDTQKIIGIVMLALIASGKQTMATIPLWIRVIGGLVMFTGTLLGGWSIMKTIGRRIFEIHPVHSVNSQMASVGAILLSTFAGAPISTTHVVVGSVMGVGAADRFKIVHWRIVREIITAWLTTIPAAAVLSAFVYFLYYALVPCQH